MKEQIREFGRSLGFETVGFASAAPPKGIAFYDRWIAKGSHGRMGYLARHRDLRADPADLLPGVRTVVAVTLNYNQENPQSGGKPRIARYALGRDYHKVLRSRLRRLAAFIESQSPGTRHRVCVDSAPILEREFAHQAGLGWFGKNTMLIDSKRGSWFFIGVVLSTAEIEPDSPSPGTCGTCTKCIDACPTQAIVLDEGRWQLDARRCVSYLTIEHKHEIVPELEERIAPWIFGCDVCQEVCPFNERRESQPERAKTTSVPDFLQRREWPSLERLASLTEDEWEVLTRGSPVRRTGLVHLRRIAQLSLTRPRGKT